MFSIFQDEMQYIFLEKNFIFLDFLAVEDAGTDVILVIFVAWNKRNFIYIALNDVSSDIFNSQKYHAWRWSFSLRKYIAFHLEMY